MIIHSLLLILQSLVTAIWAFEPFIISLLTHDGLIDIVVTAVDMTVQLMICFICVSIGSDVRLR